MLGLVHRQELEQQYIQPCFLIQEPLSSHFHQLQQSSLQIKETACVGLSMK